MRRLVDVEAPKRQLFFDAVSRELECSREELTLPTRGERESSDLRCVAYFVARTAFPSASWAALGRMFGRDRKSVRTGAARGLRLVALRRLERPVKRILREFE